MRRKLTAHELGEIGALPAIVTEQRVSIGHGLNAPMERWNVVIERIGASARFPGDHADALQQILHAIIERGDEQALLMFGFFARRNIERETLQAYRLSHRVEFGLG